MPFTLTVQDYARALRLLQLHEGLELRPYRCPAGRLTIGYGRNLEAKGITKAEAGQLLQNDLVDAWEELDKRYLWFSALEPVRQVVLVDMVYNLGIGGFLTFQKMLAALRDKDYQRAAQEMVGSLWAHQVGRRAARLAVMMQTAQWPEEVRE